MDDSPRERFAVFVFSLKAKLLGWMLPYQILTLNAALGDTRVFILADVWYFCRFSAKDTSQNWVIVNCPDLKWYNPHNSVCRHERWTYVIEYLCNHTTSMQEIKMWARSQQICGQRNVDDIYIYIKKKEMIDTPHSDDLTDQSGNDVSNMLLGGGVAASLGRLNPMAMNLLHCLSRQCEGSLASCVKMLSRQIGHFSLRCLMLRFVPWNSDS